MHNSRQHGRSNSGKRDPGTIWAMGFSSGVLRATRTRGITTDRTNSNGEATLKCGPLSVPSWVIGMPHTFCGYYSSISKCHLRGAAHENRATQVFREAQSHIDCTKTSGTAQRRLTRAAQVAVHGTYLESNHSAHIDADSSHT